MSCIFSRLSLALSFFVVIAASQHASAVITFDFDSGSQGWAPISPALSGDTKQSYTVRTAATYGASAQSGTGFVVAIDNPFGSVFQAQDSAHTTTTFWSPEFTLTDNTNTQSLTFSLLGGASAGSVPTDIASIPTSTVNSDSVGWMGVALVRISDGAIVLSKSMNDLGFSYGQGTTTWQAASFSGAELAPHVFNGTYRLALIDFREHSTPGWAWVALDSISIPGVLGAAQEVPEPSTFIMAIFCGAAGLAICIRRRKRAE